MTLTVKMVYSGFYAIYEGNRRIGTFTFERRYNSRLREYFVRGEISMDNGRRKMLTGYNLLKDVKSNIDKIVEDVNKGA